MESVSEYLYFTNWLRFIEAISANIAWPLTVLAIALLFRKQITLLLNKLKKAKLVGNELEFSREVDEFVDDAKEAGVRLSDSKVRDLRPEDAQLAVLREFAEIEEIVSQWFSDNWSKYQVNLSSSRSRRPVSFGARLRALDKYNIVSNDTAFLLDRLRQLRNEAAHSADFKLLAGEAFDFIATTEGLKNRLKTELEAAADSDL